MDYCETEGVLSKVLFIRVENDVFSRVIWYLGGSRVENCIYWYLWFLVVMFKFECLLVGWLFFFLLNFIVCVDSGVLCGDIIDFFLNNCVGCVVGFL